MGGTRTSCLVVREGWTATGLQWGPEPSEPYPQPELSLESTTQQTSGSELAQPGDPPAGTFPWTAGRLLFPAALAHR